VSVPNKVKFKISITFVHIHYTICVKDMTYPLYCLSCLRIIFFMYVYSDSHSVRCPITFHIVLTVNHCFCRLAGVHVDSVSITTFTSFACIRAYVCGCIHLLRLLSTGNPSCCTIHTHVCNLTRIYPVIFANGRMNTP
jgi:hypothetical protein